MEPESTSSVLLGLAAVVVLVLANAFFVAAEFALVGARKTRRPFEALTGSSMLRRQPLIRATVAPFAILASPVFLLRRRPEPSALLLATPFGP